MNMICFDEQVDSRKRQNTRQNTLFMKASVAKTAMENWCHIHRLLLPKSAVKKGKRLQDAASGAVYLFWRHFSIALISEYGVYFPELLYNKSIHEKLLLRRFCFSENPHISSKQFINTQQTLQELSSTRFEVLLR